MWSGITVEVNALLLPAIVGLFLMVVPVPFIGRFAARAVMLLNRKLIYLGDSYSFSPMQLIVGVVGLLFVQSWYSWRSKYSAVDFPRPKAEFMGQWEEFHAAKWRSERNIYLHAVTFVSYVALLRIAQLLLQVDELQMEKEQRKPSAPSASRGSPLTAAAADADKKSK